MLNDPVLKISAFAPRAFPLAAGLALALALGACGKTASPPPPAAPAAAAAPVPALAQPADPSQPPAEWVETGACPFEGCQYGRWTATRSVPLYDRPGGRRLQALLGTGDVVTAETGEVRAAPRRAVVAKTGPEDAANGLTQGAIVYALYPLGEGAVMVWKDGKAVATSLDVELRYDPPLPEGGLPYVWWAKVRLANGEVAWVKDASADFTGTDQFE